MVRDEQRGAGRWLTLDDEARLNAFTAADYRTLRSAFTDASADPGTCAVVLTGAGRAFSSGADRSLVDGSATDEDRAEAGTEFDALLDAMDACEVPIVAAVNGLAVGFGATILVHCDLVLAAASVRFRFPFTALGIVPEAGSSGLLAPTPQGTWAMLSSDWFDPTDGLAMGLVWRVVDDDALAAEAEASVATLAGLPRPAVVATKRLLRDGRTDARRAAMAREYAAMRQLRSTP